MDRTHLLNATEAFLLVLAQYLILVTTQHLTSISALASKAFHFFNVRGHKSEKAARACPLNFRKDDIRPIP
jgi:hypothetical protein